MWDTLFLYELEEGRKKKQAFQLKRTFTFLQIKNMKPLKRRNVAHLLKAIDKIIWIQFWSDIHISTHNIYLQV